MDMIVELRSDRQLLRRFVESKDREALEELVERHSRMVFSVCSQLLYRSEDAEDAFQAVFLVLVAKAPKLLSHECIGGWLHETATRTSLGLRRHLASSRETPMIEPTAVNHNEPWQSINATRELEVLHREIDQLPNRYRDAIVLYHLDGKSRSQIAALLCCTPGSVKAALERGRKLLRHRLLRQGVAASVILAGTGIGQSAVAAAMRTPSTLLVASTLSSCLHPNAISCVQSAALKSIIGKEVAMSMGTAKGSAFSVATAVAGLLVFALAAMGAKVGGSGSDYEQPQATSEVIHTADSSVEEATSSDVSLDEALVSASRQDDRTGAPESNNDEAKTRQKLDPLDDLLTALEKAGASEASGKGTETQTLVAMKMQLARLRTQFGNQHPKVLQLKAQIQAFERQRTLNAALAQAKLLDASQPDRDAMFEDDSAASVFDDENAQRSRGTLQVDRDSIQIVNLRHDGTVISRALRESSIRRVRRTRTEQIPNPDGTTKTEQKEYTANIPVTVVRMVRIDDAFSFVTVSGKRLTNDDVVKQYKTGKQFSAIAITKGMKLPESVQRLLKDDALVLILPDAQQPSAVGRRVREHDLFERSGPPTRELRRRQD